MVLSSAFLKSMHWLIIEDNDYSLILHNDGPNKSPENKVSIGLSYNLLIAFTNLAHPPLSFPSLYSTSLIISSTKSNILI
jgi:hypothetical protein